MDGKGGREGLGAPEDHPGDGGTLLIFRHTFRGRSGDELLAVASLRNRKSPSVPVARPPSLSLSFLPSIEAPFVAGCLSSLLITILSDSLSRFVTVRVKKARKKKERCSARPKTKTARDERGPQGRREEDGRWTRGAEASYLSGTKYSRLALVGSDRVDRPRSPAIHRCGGPRGRSIGRSIANFQRSSHPERGSGRPTSPVPSRFPSAFAPLRATTPIYDHIPS